MAYVFMNDPATGNVAVFEENGTSGDPEDPNSTRNAPLNDPVTHLAKVRFHNAFDYYQVDSDTSGIVVNHALVASASTAVSSQPVITRVGQVVKTNINLLAHGLPYAPAYMIVSNDGLIGQSSLIQVASGRSRRVSPWANSTHIGLLDVGISSASSLAALSKTYRVIVFKQPVETDSYMADIDLDAGVLSMGYGKWRGDLKQLRQAVLADASPFDVPLGRTSDIRNGTSRTVLADGTVFTSSGYDGSFAGSASIQCSVE
ncbi:hypothetical protein [Devosia sp. Root635]|uniref:hypothetical protein n=1 Tax=Devosia sp. Root635 TaxID=1736575 RepID=UPI0006F65DCB|nr:hypothetical protein [Devosia sp. Root635]KRA42087.1 hypothetical protein ASD80_10190 [Devosia sp. Root635]